MYECETCTATFWSRFDCEDHMADSGHWPECETCPRAFRTQRACNQHMNDTNHWELRFECETCPKQFRFEVTANQHMKDRGHYKNYCKDCDRRFQNQNSLQMHLNSKIHRGSNVLCPFCKTGFTTASGLTHHLETGSCPRAPALNREAILRMVRKRDPHGLITNKQIEWHQEERSHFSATNLAFNGSFWECYLCHRRFNTVKALNAHLNSPVHKQKAYRCPNSKATCGKQFITLAALFNHLESEACSFMRFEKVQQQVGDVLQGRKLIAFS